MKKKFFLSLMAIATLAGAMTLAGCDKSENGEDLPNGGGEKGDATSVELNQTRLDMDINGTFQLQAILPAETKIKKVEWKSSNPKVASVSSDGFVTAISKGTANITASSKKASATCKITVSGKEVELEPIDPKVIGGFDPKTYDRNATAKVQFNRFPVSVKEFKEVREKIGKAPEGVVALELMAFEMYHRNPAIGMECVKLVTDQSYHRDITDGLKRIYGKYQDLARPYQVATFLEGSERSNGYNPSHPYVVSMKASGNPYSRYEKYNTVLIEISVYTSGSRINGVPTREVTVYKRSSQEYYMVHGCGGFIFAGDPLTEDYPAYKGLK